MISTSKIRKITAIKKKCNENGKRADVFGSNPHSKGDLFSRSINLFLEIIFTTKIKIKLIIKINIKIEAKMINIYTKYVRFFDWKSKIIFILYK